MELRKYLPSLPFALLIGAFALSGLLIYGASYVGAGKKSASLSISTGAPSDTAAASLDTDNDSLPDWQEALYETSARNADTDGDGTIDGEEVKVGRDPNKSGPNDTLVSKENAQFLSELINTASSSNITDDISQRLFAQYAQALNASGSTDIQTQEAIVQDAVARAKVPLRGKTYTPEDLTIVVTTKESIRAFANQTALAIQAHPKASFLNTVVVFGAAMDESDPRSEQAFPILGKDYQDLSKDLLRTPVPDAYASLYLQIINTYEKGGASFEDMGYYQKDPIRALAGFANYMQMMRISIDVLKGLAQKVADSGILFSEDEPGIVWETFLVSSI